MDDYDVEIALSLMKLLRQAEKKDVSLELRRQAGFYVEGQRSMDKSGRILMPEEIPDEHKIPLARGWLISVNNDYFVSEDDEERVYQSLVGAIAAGFMLLEDT